MAWFICPKCLKLYKKFKNWYNHSWIHVLTRISGKKLTLLHLQIVAMLKIWQSIFWFRASTCWVRPHIVVRVFSKYVLPVFWLKKYGWSIFWYGVCMYFKKLVKIWNIIYLIQFEIIWYGVNKMQKRIRNIPRQTNF